MNIKAWYLDTVGEDSENAVAEKSGIGQTTINRQRKTGKITPEVVVAIARAYDKSPLEGLMTLELITDQDIKRHGTDVLLREISDRHLADEVWDRMQKGRMDENGEPLDKGPQKPEATVHHLFREDSVSDLLDKVPAHEADGSLEEFENREH